MTINIKELYKSMTLGKKIAMFALGGALLFGGYSAYSALAQHSNNCKAKKYSSMINRSVSEIINSTRMDSWFQDYDSQKNYKSDQSGVELNYDSNTEFKHRSIFSGYEFAVAENEFSKSYVILIPTPGKKDKKSIIVINKKDYSKANFFLYQGDIEESCIEVFYGGTFNTGSNHGKKIRLGRMYVGGVKAVTNQWKNLEGKDLALAKEQYSTLNDLINDFERVFSQERMRRDNWDEWNKGMINGGKNGNR